MMGVIHEFEHRTYSAPMGYEIIVADDDALLRALVVEWLSPEGYEVVPCGSASALRKRLKKSPPNFLLLDVMLGKTDGINLCRELKTQTVCNDFPIVLISGERMERTDQAAGLLGGADDFLLKPIDPIILRAKVAAFRRRAVSSPTPKRMERHGLVVDLDRRQAFASGTEITLTRKEFNLLTFFLKRPGELFSPKALLENVWGCENPQDRQRHTVEEHIYRLKKKLGESFSSNLSVVVGEGYRFR